ncbi:MAG: hypothetical protein E7004_03975 [Alphaproteobacteria bacterium]|nr:hypothetical protein [Alphaproteobacteria bacterium]
MKKFVLTLLMALMFCNPAFARRGGHHHGHFHYRGHHGGIHAVGDLAWGVAGVVAGAALINNLVSSSSSVKYQQPKVYIAEPEGECYITVSRKTGDVKEKCFNRLSKGIIYVD